MQGTIDKITEFKIKELVGEREELYRKIKEKLTLLIIKSVKDAEEIRGYEGYWKLYDERLKSFGLTRADYKRIIDDLEEVGLIKARWSSDIGGYITTNFST
jgi:Cdc6-like AAA superfamily ATPase